MKRSRRDDLKKATKAQFDSAHRLKESTRAVNALLARDDVSAVRVGSKVYKVAKRRPSTATLKRVIDWMAEQELEVIGPAGDLEKGVLHECGYQNYTLAQILQLAQLRKKYPKGIPLVAFDDEENAG